MQEEWRPITFQEGLSHYEVSNLGHVRSLDRTVKTRIVNHGKEMFVMVHRKGRDVGIQLDRGRSIVRMLDESGTRRKFSLGLLVLRVFSECPGDPKDFTAGYIDGDVNNNNINNLTWISKRDMIHTIGTSKGYSRPDLYKYKNIIIKVHNQVVGYFENMSEGADLFNSYGFNTSLPAISRAFKDTNKFFYIFDLTSVTDEEFIQISRNYSQLDLKIIYDIVMFDRKCRGINTEPRRIHEKDKEEKKKLVNSSTTNVKETKNKEIKTRETKVEDIKQVQVKDIKSEEDIKPVEDTKQVKITPLRSMSKDEFMSRLSETLFK